MPKCSIILVTFNRLDYTKQTIDSLLKTASSDFEMFIIDNASSELGFHDYLTELEKDKRITIIRNYKNVGWGKATNLGLKLCRTDWILLSNNDVIYKENWFEKCLLAYEDFPEIGILGLWKHPFHTILGEKQGKRSKIIIKDQMPGVAWLMKKEVLDKIGPIAEAGPCDRQGGCGEDTNYCARVRGAGFLVCGLNEDIAEHITKT